MVHFQFTFLCAEAHFSHVLSSFRWTWLPLPLSDSCPDGLNMPQRRLRLSSVRRYTHAHSVSSSHPYMVWGRMMLWYSLSLRLLMPPSPTVSHDCRNSLMRASSLSRSRRTASRNFRRLMSAAVLARPLPRRPPAPASSINCRRDLIVSVF